MCDDNLHAKLSRLIGTWDTEATHPAFPGVVVRGTVEVTWLEGERFLVHRGRTDHEAFPDSISILGLTGRDRVGKPGKDGEEPRLAMNYFDSRGVSRVYEMSIDDTAWRWWRDTPGFSQRFTGTFKGNDVIEGVFDLNQDDRTWKQDLVITYRKKATP